MALKRQTVENSVQKIFFLVALASITTLFLIMVFLFKEGLPIFKSVSIKDFVFGHYWYPTSE
ncbi:MAG: phosphate ABC transporter permease subunit PstC, partial [Deltaproteobacteria bacterium]|nr:phosphate ABC transporter permease subunit PstC [Deltaproteobacteria bacterium]